MYVIIQLQHGKEADRDDFVVPLYFVDHTVRCIRTFYGGQYVYSFEFYVGKAQKLNPDALLLFKRCMVAKHRF